jgi:hypothetical protein
MKAYPLYFVVAKLKQKQVHLMIIMVFAFKCIADFLLNGKDYEVSRPTVCLSALCGRSNCFWKHTGYIRNVLDNEEPVSVAVPRFRCKFCGLVISCLFSFLVPYRRFSAEVVGGSAEAYAAGSVASALLSYRKIAENLNCSRMAVFRWTEFLGKKAGKLRGQVQKEFMLAGGTWEELSAIPEDGRSPSSGKAKSEEKETLLNELFGLVEISKIFIGSTQRILEKLHTHFLRNIESK